MFSIIIVLTFLLISINPNDGANATLRSTSFHSRRGLITTHRLKTNITLSLVSEKQPSLESLPSTIKRYKSCTAAVYRANWPCRLGGFREMRRHDTCVAFIDDRSKAKNWWDARTACRNLKADLVKIPNKEFEAALDSIAPGEKTRWIGLHADRHRTFKWLDEGSAATYFNWASGNPNNYRGIQDCVTKGYRKPGLWDDDDCTDKSSFICQQISERALHKDSNKLKPILVVDTLEAPGRSYIQADCAAFIDSGGQIRLGYTTARGEGRMEKLGDPSITVVEDGVYLMKDDRCTRRYRSRLKLQAVAEVHRGKVTCCSVRAASQWKCRHSGTLTVVFSPQAPELRVDKSVIGSTVYVGGNLLVRCRALVGTDGRLIWKISFSDETYVWVNSVSGNSKEYSPSPISTATDVDWKQDAKVIVDQMNGPRFESVMRVVIVPRMRNVSLACNVNEDPMLTNTTVFNVKFPPKKPQMEVFYHESPDWVIEHSTLHASCSCFVGTGGSLIWSLEGGIIPRAQSWSVSVSGDVDGDMAKYITVEATPATPDEQIGPLLKSNISIESSYMLENVTLSCYTPLPYDYRAQMEIQATELIARSLPFQVIFLPKPPLILAKYMEEQQYPYTVFLNISCTAFVGTEGILRWVLDAFSGPVVWAFNVDGEWTSPEEEEAPDVNVSQLIVIFDSRYGPKITSNIQLQVTPELEQADLYCFSYNSTAVLNLSDTEDELRASHKIDSRAHLRKASSDRYSPGWAMFLATLAALFLVLLTIATNQQCVSKRAAARGIPESAGESRVTKSDASTVLSDSNVFPAINVIPAPESEYSNDVSAFESRDISTSTSYLESSIQ